jgi:outer membrane biogenesis lipoprotein LolB
MLHRVVSTTCAIALLAACTVTTPGTTQAQTAKQTAEKKVVKKPAKKTTRAGGQPATGANDRSVIPALHDARHGY